MTSQVKVLASHIAQAAAMNLDTLGIDSSNRKIPGVLSRTLTKTLAEGEQLSIEKGRVKAFKEGNKAWTFTNCLASLGYRFEPKLHVSKELYDKEYDIEIACSEVINQSSINIPSESQNYLLIPADKLSPSLKEAPSIVRSQVTVLSEIRDNPTKRNDSITFPSGFAKEYHKELTDKIDTLAQKTREDAISSGTSTLKNLAGTAAIIAIIYYSKRKS